jgi:4-amino-4-deoxy-L-arabinose transferase-like glycosyltransferase
LTTAAPVTIPPEKTVTPPRSTKAFWAMFALFAVVYFGSLFSPALFDDADSTHAEAAREMVVRGDYVTLHVNGIRYLEKAPLMYWLVAMGYLVFGAHEFATRLPTAIAVLLTVFLAYRWARRAFDERTGIYAGLFVSTAVGYYLFTRILIPEALLSLLIAASIYFFETALEANARPWRWYAGYASVALAVLTKGLVAIVFVGATMFAFLLITGDWRRWREFRLLSGTALFLLIAAPWHLLAGFRNHGFFWFYFINEHVLRFLGRRYPKDYSKLPALLYWSLHLAWLFPWSMYFPLALRDGWRKFRAAPKSREASLDFGYRTRLLCWLWAGIILVFFSISTNQEYYTFPAYLPLVLLLAAAISSEEFDTNRTHSPWLIASTALVAITALISGGLLVAGLWNSRHLPFTSDIGTVLAAHDLSNDKLSMSHMLDLSDQSFAALRLPAILAAIALSLGPLLSLLLRLRRRHWAATWAMAGTMTVFLVAAHIALERFEPYLSSRPLADKIAAQLKPGDKVMIYGDQAFGTSLLFYLHRPIDLINGNTSSMWFGSTFPDAPKVYLTDADLLRAWSSPTRVFLFVTIYQKARVESLIQLPRYVIAESSGKTIYSNQPGP